jgi:diguanylate cyclase (GGDEF)-like protein
LFRTPAVVQNVVQILRTPKQKLILMGVLAAIYFAAGKLGLTLALVNPSATAVWPAAGIALAALLIFGYWAWPGVLLGAFLANVTTAGTVASSFGIAVGNSLEGLLGAYLVTRFAAGKKAFDRPPDTFKFAWLAGMMATTVSATFGVTTLALAGLAKWSAYGTVWLTWWLGDAAGIVIVAPLLILWSADYRLHWTRQQFFEALCLLLGLIVAGQMVFDGFLVPGTSKYPLEYMCIPFLIWAAYRFGQREAAAATLVLVVSAVSGTFHGFGPFIRQTENESLLMLQAFMAVVAVTIMGLAAVFEDRKRAVEQARHLAVSDPLTELANYRKLIDTLETEIKRYGRNQRPFAILLVDLDGLKKINDTQGHLAGNRALCRVADVLRNHCRDVDMAARHGGDEFALILPEAGNEAAQQVAQRIAEGVTEGTEPQALSVSIGVAICPEDGDTVEKLLAAADHDLYEMKRRVRRKLPTSVQDLPEGSA